MKPFLIFFLFAAVVAADAQTIKDNHIIMGNVDSVYSKSLNEKRKIWVYVPAGANNAVFSQRHYPVVYLLDGDAHFPSVTGMIQQLSEVNGNSICPDMIVVGIPNTDRTRDLTPSNSLTDPTGKTAPFFKTSGGGEKFTTFIEKELMPHIDSIYPTAPYKVLIGHSFGGLTAMNILINHTNMFNAYVVIDPSMWWDKKKLLNQSREVLKQQIFEGKSVFLGIANTMAAGMDTLQVRKDTTGNSAHIRSILELADIFKSNPANGLNFKYKYYNDDNHGSVPLIAEYDALHFLFGFNKFPPDDFAKLYDPNDKSDPVAIINAHFENVSKHLGYKVLPPEDMINGLGYFYLQSGKADKAYAIFAMNIQNYPQSFNVYDSMGDYYDAKKDKEKTIEYYTKALKLKENPDTRGKLNKITAAK
jgi:predicted alpha/beta superfamily hydrolase